MTPNVSQEIMEISRGIITDSQLQKAGPHACILRLGQVMKPEHLDGFYGLFYFSLHVRFYLSSNHYLFISSYSDNSCTGLLGRGHSPLQSAICGQWALALLPGAPALASVLITVSCPSGHQLQLRCQQELTCLPPAPPESSLLCF